jgi:hypothetical protein
MTKREEVLVKKLDALRGEIRKGRRDIKYFEEAICYNLDLYNATLLPIFTDRIKYLKDNIEISKSAITKMENELWRTSQELYLERSIQRKAEKPKECDYFYGQDDICLVNELLKNGIIRGIKF